MNRSRFRIAAGLLRRRAVCVPSVVAALIAAGCRPEVEYYGVYGTVTMNGKPVEYAEMHVHPTTQKANRGRTVLAMVVNGRYDTRDFGGVAAGPAEWTFAVAEPGSMKIADPNNISSEEKEQFLNVKKRDFVLQIEVKQEEINVELP